MGTDNLMGKSHHELLSELDAVTKELVKCRFKKAMGNLRDTASWGKIRKQRARIKTAISLKSK